MIGLRFLAKWILPVFALVLYPAAAAAETLPGDEAAVRSLIAQWYEEQRAGPDGRPDRLKTSRAIDASPGYFHENTGAAVLGPRTYNSLAYTSLQFDHEITRLVIDPRLARAEVWERGFTFAWAAQKTTERAGMATFVLEKQDDGRWLILAHQTNTVGIPPDRRTDPLPDLRELFYSTVGKDRDPEEDARNAGNR